MTNAFFNTLVFFSFFLSSYYYLPQIVAIHSTNCLYSHENLHLLLFIFLLVVNVLLLCFPIIIIIIVYRIIIYLFILLCIDSMLMSRLLSLSIDEWNGHSATQILRLRNVTVKRTSDAPTLCSVKTILRLIVTIFYRKSRKSLKIRSVLHRVTRSEENTEKVEEKNHTRTKFDPSLNAYQVV